MKILHSDATPESLRFWRVVLFTLLLFGFNQDPWTIISNYSMTDYLGAWIYRYLPISVSEFLVRPEVLSTMQIANSICLILVILGFFQRYAGLLACVLMTTVYSFMYSWDMGSHANVPPLLAAFIMVFVFFAQHRDKKKGLEPKNYAPAALQITAFLFLITYTFVGMHRLTFGAPGVFAEDVMPYWFAKLSSWGPYQYGLMVVDNPIILKLLWIGFPIVTAIEILAPLSLISNKIKWIFIIVMVPFHFMTLFLMNIFFSKNLIMMVFLLFNYSVFFNPKPGKGKSPLVLFDGVCGLCNRTVDYLLKTDRVHIFKYAPLQGTTASSMIGDLPESTTDWSVILVDEEGVHKRSDAALRIWIRMGGPLSLLSALCYVYIPRFIRDGVYRFIAWIRYPIFGKRETCRLPSESERALFLP